MKKSFFFWLRFPCDSRAEKASNWKECIFKHLIVMQSVDWRIELLFFVVLLKIEKNEKKTRTKVEKKIRESLFVFWGNKTKLKKKRVLWFYFLFPFGLYWLWRSFYALFRTVFLTLDSVLMTLDSFRDVLEIFMTLFALKVLFTSLNSADQDFLNSGQCFWLLKFLKTLDSVCSALKSSGEFLWL